MPTKLKTSDEARNTTVTLADDGELSVSLAASTVYFIEICVLFNSPAAAAIQVSTLYSGTLNGVGIQHFGTLARDNQTSSSQHTPRSFSASTSWFTTGPAFAIAGSDVATSAGLYHFRGVMHTNTAGTLKVRWAQNVSNGSNTTVFAGSYISYEAAADMPGLIVKMSDETRTNTASYAADADLQYPVLAGESYIAEMFMKWTSSSAPDFKHKLSDANVSQAVGGDRRHALADDTQPSNALGNYAGVWTENMFTTPLEVGHVMGAIPFRMWAYWGLVQGGADDVVACEWAQSTSSASPTTMNKYSWLWYEQVF